MHESGYNSHLLVESVRAEVGGFALRDINLSCRRGEFHILVGPTGSGKSTLMKCILGLKKVKQGRVVLNRRDITNELPERRRMGYIPQNCALFPHLDVEQNLRFGLGARRTEKSRADTLIDDLCGLLDITHLRTRRIHDLSGGEQQKVAIGRALAIEPEIILLDEPFSSIDEGARRNLWLELKRIVQEVGITALHITHNLEEAYALGENMSVLMDGRVVQSGSREDIFEEPVNESVARFLNYRNIFTGIAHTHPSGSRVDMGNFGVVVSREIAEGARVQACVRPRDIKILREETPVKDALKRNCFSGRVAALYTLPDHCVMHFAIDGSPQAYDFELKFPLHIVPRHNLHPGKPLNVAFWEPSIIVFGA